MTTTTKQYLEALAHLAGGIFNFVSTTSPVPLACACVQIFSAFAKLHSVKPDLIKLMEPAKTDLTIDPQKPVISEPSTPTSVHFTSPPSTPQTPVPFPSLSTEDTTTSRSTISLEYEQNLKDRVSSQLEKISLLLQKCCDSAQVDKWSPIELTDKNCKVIEMIKVIPLLRTAAHDWQGVFSDCVCSIALIMCFHSWYAFSATLSSLAFVIFQIYLAKHWR